MAKVEEVRDGVFVQQRISGDAEDAKDPAAWEAIFRPFMPEKLLEDLEARIAAVIAEPKSERQGQDAEAAARRLKNVRKCLQENDAGGVLVQFHQLMNALWRADIRPFEGGIFHKAALQDFGRRASAGKKDRGEETRRELRYYAERIKKEPGRSKWSDWQVAKEIKRQGLSTLSERWIWEKIR